jgi:ferredoxin
MKLIAIYFSPTGSTRRYTQVVTAAMGKETTLVDITLPRDREQIISIQEEIILLGFPIYGMRIPMPVLEYLKQLRGNGNPLAVMAVYGNMGRGIVFAQVNQIAKKQNFRLIGAGFFLAEHSFSTDEFPVGKGRPDEDDLLGAQQYGEKLSAKIESGIWDLPKKETFPLSTVIAKAPYGGTRFLLRQPRVDLQLCTQCFQCQKKCPNGAITDSLVIIESKCLRCFACVKVCPANARQKQFKGNWMGNVFAKIGKKPKRDIVYLKK